MLCHAEIALSACAGSGRGAAEAGPSPGVESLRDGLLQVGAVVST